MPDPIWGGKNKALGHGRLRVETKVSSQKVLSESYRCLNESNGLNRRNNRVESGTDSDTCSRSESAGFGILCRSDSFRGV